MSLKTKFILTICLIAFFICELFSQPTTERYKHLGQIFIPQFGSAPFPHSKRMEGHSYKNQSFPFQEHYADSSVLIFVPKGFRPTQSTNIVVYFHGWYNNIDSACVQFKLLEQFSESNKNAIFIFPEGPKNSPDSFGGKMEDKDGLKKLLDDVTKYLKKKRIVKTTKIGSIVLAGHSGAYRAIAYSVDQGGLIKNISDVFMFDALYAETDKINNWIKNFNGRFINIYTNEGGTKEESETMMHDLDSLAIPYFKAEEKDLAMQELVKNRLIFIHTDLAHEEVINARKQFYNYLKTSKITSHKN